MEEDIIISTSNADSDKDGGHEHQDYIHCNESGRNSSDRNISGSNSNISDNLKDVEYDIHFNMIDEKFKQKKEIRAWWLYMAGIEPMSAVVVQLFLINILNELEGSFVIVQFLAIGIQTALFVILGPVSDYSDNRKTMLRITTVVGILCCSGISILPLLSYPHLLVSFLAIAIICSFGLSSLFYNSYLPILSERYLAICEEDDSVFSCVNNLNNGTGGGGFGSPSSMMVLINANAIVEADDISIIDFEDDRERREENLRQVDLLMGRAALAGAAEDEARSGGSSIISLHQEIVEEKRKSKRRSLIMSNLSGKSFLFGFSASTIILAIISLSFWAIGRKRYNNVKMSCLVVGICGLWWAMTSIYPLRKLTMSNNRQSHSIGLIRKIKEMPHTFRFLLVYFMFSDATNTFGMMAAMVARSSMKVGNQVMINCAMIAPIGGVISSLFLHFIQKRRRMQPKKILVISLCLMVFLCFYCSLGLLFCRRGGEIGLGLEWELYSVALSYGILNGSILSYSRSIYGEMIPRGEEGEFYSLYAITDRGSSLIGPLLLILINRLTNDIRYGFIVLIVMISVTIPFILLCIDPRRGEKDSVDYLRRRDVFK